MSLLKNYWQTENINRQRMFCEFIVSLKTPLLSKTIQKTISLFSVKSYKICQFIHVFVALFMSIGQTIVSLLITLILCKYSCFSWFYDRTFFKDIKLITPTLGQSKAMLMSKSTVLKPINSTCVLETTNKSQQLFSVFCSISYCVIFKWRFS